MPGLKSLWTRSGAGWLPERRSARLSTAQIVAPFRRLHVSQRSSRLRAVFDPPLLTGM